MNFQNTSAHLVLAPPRSRPALRFTPETVRAHVPLGIRGAYLLLSTQTGAPPTPIYIGRSDSCLRTRLASHPLLGCATHFLWHRTYDALHAYRMEAFWYHQLQNRLQKQGVRNLIHPARPAGWTGACPFCTGHAEVHAIARAFAVSCP